MQIFERLATNSLWKIEKSEYNFGHWLTTAEGNSSKTYEYAYPLLCLIYSTISLNILKLKKKLAGFPMKFAIKQKNKKSRSTIQIVFFRTLVVQSSVTVFAAACSKVPHMTTFSCFAFSSTGQPPVFNFSNFFCVLMCFAIQKMLLRVI